jgi:hypothetical protein
MRIGQVYVDVYDKLLRSSWFGLTGTYYDKDLLDVVYRYDFAYRPHVGYNHATPATKALDTGPSGLDYGSWTDEFIGVIAGDRPTYIPWLSKQHTFIVAQWTTNWFISAHGHDIPTIVSPQGKLRKYQNVAFVAAANWLFDGRLVTTNVIFWDIDTMAGFLGSTNLFRYSRNVLLGLNLQWYMGASGKYTDPFTMSRDQRISEIEFKFGYEL